MLALIVKKYKGVYADKNFAEIFSGSILTFSAKIGAVILGFISNVIVAKNYGSEIVGILALITSFLAITTLVSAAGLPTTMLRVLSSKISNGFNAEARTLTWKATKIVCFVALLVTIISSALVPLISQVFIGSKVVDGWVYVAVLMVIAPALMELNSAIIRVYKRIELFALIQVLQPLSYFLVLIVVTLFAYEDDRPIYIYFCSILFAYLLSQFFVKKCARTSLLKQEEVTDLSSWTLIKVSWPILLTGVMWLCINQTAVLMLGGFVSLKEVGIYFIVVKLGMLANFVLTSVNMVSAPKFAELYSSNDLESLRKLTQKTSRFLFYINLPLLLVLIIGGDLILGVFGEEFKSGYTALIFLVIGQFVNVACGSVGNFLNMTGSQKAFNKIVTTAAALNLGLCWGLIPSLGIVGAGLASSITACYWNVASLLYIKIKYGFFIGFSPFSSKGRAA